jgi:predicted alpha/beta superfamily hydrolase
LSKAELPPTSGTLELRQSIESIYLREARDAIVYLPPGYSDAGERRYPVLYLHDGQNLFDAATAFLNNSWGLGPSVDQAILQRLIQPLIIVGIYNAGVDRITEYTQLRDRSGQGGQAMAYGKFIIRELKPLIDSRYRTQVNSASTGLGGSSLGGLVTLFLGLSNPQIFGKLIVMSPSVWWANRAIVREVRKRAHHRGQKMWLDIGTAEGQAAEVCLNDVRELCGALVAKGWSLGDDLCYLEDKGAEHNECAWGARMSRALHFLFPSARSGD